jgi:hypothetical protein
MCLGSLLQKRVVVRWSYKTVLFELKKEGLLGSSFIDESEIEESLNEFGKAGWELVSMIDTKDGLIAVFKQLLDIHKTSFPVKRPDIEEEPLLSTFVQTSQIESEPEDAPEPESVIEFEREDEQLEDELGYYPDDDDYAEDEEDEGEEKEHSEEIEEIEDTEENEDTDDSEDEEEDEDSDDSDFGVGGIRIE